MLQDICSSSGLLPRSYGINSDSVSRDRRIAGGAEVIVYRAKYRDNVVAVREFHRPEHGWTEREGQSVFRVSVSYANFSLILLSLSLMPFIAYHS